MATLSPGHEYDEAKSEQAGIEYASTSWSGQLSTPEIIAPPKAVDGLLPPKLRKPPCARPRDCGLFRPTAEEDL